MKTGKTILVNLPVTDQQLKSLAAQAPGCDLHTIWNKPCPREQIQAAQVILGNVPLDDLAGSDQLEWLQLFSAGTGDYVSSGRFPAGALLTNATGAYGLAISEHMLGMLLMIQKKLSLYRDNQQRGLWHSEGPVTAIDGSTTLVIGLGDIGGSFARRMKALGSYTIGIKRHPSAKPDELDELYQADALDDLLPRADVIALTLPETSETRCLIDRSRLLAMKRSAILLNVGRGTVLDTDALCDVLESGHLLGAGLDVTDPEPLPPDHRLWRMTRAVITPHVSGGFHLPQTLHKIIDLATENLHRYIHNRPLINIVDFQTGYRAFQADPDHTLP